MPDRSRLVLSAFALAAGLLCGCPARQPSPGPTAEEPDAGAAPGANVPDDKGKADAGDHKPFTLVVRSMKPRDEARDERRSRVVKYGLTWADYDRFMQIETVIGLVPLRTFPLEVHRLERVSNARVVATTEAFAQVNRFEMAAGRFLKDKEDQATDGNVIVLSEGVAGELFPAEKKVVGQTVTLGKHSFSVVGVIRNRLPKGKPANGKVAEDADKAVYIPVQTSRLRFGETVFIRQGGSRDGERVELHQIVLILSDGAKVRGTADVIRNLLERDHGNKDWEVVVPDQP